MMTVLVKYTTINPVELVETLQKEFPFAKVSYKEFDTEKFSISVFGENNVPKLGRELAKYRIA